MHFFGLHSSTHSDVARAYSTGVYDAQRVYARLKKTSTALFRRRVSRRRIIAVAISRDAFPALDIASSRRTKLRRARLPSRRIQCACSISCVRPNGALVDSLPRLDSDLLPYFISSSPTSRARSIASSERERTVKMSDRRIRSPACCSTFVDEDDARCRSAGFGRQNQRCFNARVLYARDEAVARLVVVRTNAGSDGLRLDKSVTLMFTTYQC